MQRLSLVSLAFLLAFAPSQLFAKAATTQVTIEGNHFKFEIANPKMLAPFKIWSGPGTSSNGVVSTESQSFIVDWSKGPLAAPPALPRYRVSFYGILPGEKSESLLYVVTYAFDPATGQGYVYLPGAADPDYKLNVSRILRGVEGKWFHAWSAWDEVAGPRIAASLAALHSWDGPALPFAGIWQNEWRRRRIRLTLRVSRPAFLPATWKWWRNRHAWIRTNPRKRHHGRNRARNLNAPQRLKPSSV